MDSFNLRVIAAVKTCPNLYKNDVSLECRKKQWQTLSKRFSLDEDLLRRRWHMLRESFIRSQSTLDTADRAEDGICLDERFIGCRRKTILTGFAYKNEMQFLLPYVQSRIAAEKEQLPELEFVITQADLEVDLDDSDECAFKELDEVTPNKLQDYKASNCKHMINPENQAMANMLLELNELPNAKNNKNLKKTTEVSVAMNSEKSKNTNHIAVRKTGQLIPRRIVSKRTVQSLPKENVRVVTEKKDPVVSNEEVKKEPIPMNEEIKKEPIPMNEEVKKEPIPMKTIFFKNIYRLIPANTSKSLTTSAEHNEIKNAVQDSKRENEKNISTNAPKVLVSITKPDECAHVGLKVIANVLKNTEPLPKSTNNSVTKKNEKLTTTKKATEAGVRTKTDSAVVDNTQKAAPIPETSCGVQTMEKKQRAGKKFVVINKSCYASSRTTFKALKKNAQKRNLYRMFGNFIGDVIGQMPPAKRRQTMNQMISLLYK